jgi:hypothetical protein
MVIEVREVMLKSEVRRASAPYYFQLGWLLPSVQSSPSLVVESLLAITSKASSTWFQSRLDWNTFETI